jgi:TRAP-type C4-dicarboxylate transport system substrate-binding protein
MGKKVCRRLFFWMLVLIIVAVSLPTSAGAGTQVIRVGNWVPMHHAIVKGILQPWAEAIEKESGNTLKFEIMKSALGRPSTYFDLLIDGTVDVTYGVCGHVVGRFPMTQIMDYPFMSPDPWAGSAASWMTYQRYGQKYGEFKGTKLLGLWVYTEPYINMTGPPIKKMEDLSGKKIRVGCAVQGDIFKALDATPVQIPPTEAQQAMARGVADGICFPLESVEFFKITPAIKSSTLIPGGLYNDTFWFAFNLEKWNSLTDEQRAAIEKHSGMALAMQAGWAWSKADEWGRTNMEKKGVQFAVMSDQETQRIKDILKSLEKEWIEQGKKKGFNSEEILSYARDIAHQYRSSKQVNVP